MADVLADHAALRAIADAGGGSFRTLDGLPALLADLAAAVRPVYEPVGRSLPLVSGPAFLAVLIGLFTAEWGLRRLWGLA